MESKGSKKSSDRINEETLDSKGLWITLGLTICTKTLHESVGK